MGTSSAATLRAICISCGLMIEDVSTRAISRRRSSKSVIMLVLGADGFRNDIGLKVLKPGSRSANVSAVMPASGYGPPVGGRLWVSGSKAFAVWFGADLPRLGRIVERAELPWVAGTRRGGSTLPEPTDTIALHIFCLK